MKNKAIMFVFLLCVTIFLTGCELPWGDCGPPELSRFPLGLTLALEEALSPDGIITRMVEDGAATGIICDDSQSITYGPAYLRGTYNTEVQSASSEAIFVFPKPSHYEFVLYCHGQAMGRVDFAKFPIWRMIGIGGIEGMNQKLVALEDYLGPDFSDCTRGVIYDYHIQGNSCAIVTDKQGITRFYPLNPDNPTWGNTEGKGIGEFSLTKEEFFEWYHNNIDLDS